MQIGIILMLTTFIAGVIFLIDYARKLEPVTVVEVDEWGILNNMEGKR